MSLPMSDQAFHDDRLRPTRNLAVQLLNPAWEPLLDNLGCCQIRRLDDRE